MDTTELIKNSLDWADKRLDLKGEKLTEEQRNYITFALRQNLVKNIAVTHCCKSDSELLCEHSMVVNRETMNSMICSKGCGHEIK